MSDDDLLELLDIYIDLTEKQDKTILELSKMVVKLATDLANLRNLTRAEAEEVTDAEAMIEKIKENQK